MEEKIEIVGNPDETCVLVKVGYDNYVKYIKGRIAALGLTIGEEGKVFYDEEAASKHYIAHKGRPYYKGLIDYITSGSVYFLEVLGKDARIKIDENKKSIREAVLSCFPNLSDEDRKTKNVIHATDLVTDAQYELNIGKDLLHKDLNNNL